MRGSLVTVAVRNLPDRWSHWSRGWTRGSRGWGRRCVVVLVRETESRVPIYIGYNFRRGDDRSVAIGRESEIRGNVKIAVDSLVEIALTILPNRNVTRRGLWSGYFQDRILRSTLNIRILHTSRHEIFRFGTLKKWMGKRYHPPYTNRYLILSKIHRNDAFKWTDVRDRKVAHRSCRRMTRETVRCRSDGTGRTKRTPFRARTPPSKGPKFRRGRRDAWRDATRRTDAWWRAREWGPRCVREAGSARA